MSRWKRATSFVSNSESAVLAFRRPTKGHRLRVFLNASRLLAVPTDSFFPLFPLLRLACEWELIHPME